MWTVYLCLYNSRAIEGLQANKDLLEKKEMRQVVNYLTVCILCSWKLASSSWKTTFEISMTGI